MAKERSSEAKLARVCALRGETPSPAVLQELRKALADASFLVVAEAAELAGKLPELAADLVSAFDRLLDQPAKSDPRCRAKIALIEALNKMEYTGEEVFLRGIRCVQLEGVWGGEVDTAGPVRVSSAFGLVRNRHRGVLVLLIDMLADADRGVRAGAAQALAYVGTEAAGLLLRLKARLGDKDTEVISECFTGLLQLTPETALDFVAEFLHSSQEAIQEAAILALGGSRRKEAFDALKKFWETHVSRSLQEATLLALALLRLPAANDLLLSLVMNEAPAQASAALNALVIHRYDARLRERIATAVSQTENQALQSQFDKKFKE